MPSRFSLNHVTRKHARMFMVALVLFTHSCERAKISSAFDNTVYPGHFSSSDPAQFNATLVGKNVDEFLSEFGKPLFITHEENSASISDASVIDSFPYHQGTYRMTYSVQRNPVLDYIRLSCVVSGGKVKEVENVLYEE